MHGLKNYSKYGVNQWILTGKNTKKFIDMVSDSTFELTFKKYLLLNFDVVSNNN